MKTVVLTSGPRGAGKSTFVDAYASRSLDVRVLSRDKLLVDLFETTTLDRYSGGHYLASKLFLEQVEQALHASEDAKLIVDYWNGFSHDRRSLIREYTHLGAQKIVCWKFMTPKEVCVDWFMKKEDSAGYTTRMVKNDYDLYHQESQNILSDGFDQIHYINPLQLQLPFSLSTLSKTY